MKKPNKFTLNEFYDTLSETFAEMEYEFVGTEEYENAALMLNAQKEILHEQELHNILHGNRIIHPTSRTKESNK